MNKDDFLAQANKRHGSLYDYSKVEIRTRRDKVMIGCVTHGFFRQQAGNHLNGQGCPRCGRLRNAQASASRAVGTETFIVRAKAKHGDRYGYAKVVYKDQNTPVEIDCPIHGTFRQTPKTHAGGHGCPLCYRDRKPELSSADPDTQLAKWSRMWPNMDFSQSIYRGCRDSLTAICCIHGEITKPAYYWNIFGCPQCGRESALAAPKKTAHLQIRNQARFEEQRIKFLEFAVANSDRFDFSRAVYAGVDGEMTVTCRVHDLTYSTNPKRLYAGHGCRRCGAESLSEQKRLSRDEVMARIQEVHGSRYDYPAFVYQGQNEKITIICHKHGSFEQTPHNHFSGMGCPSCGNQASRHEEAMQAWLQGLGVEVQRRNRKIIAPKEIDLWIPDKQLGIEIHGLYWHREEQAGNLHRQKWELAQAAGIRLIQIFEDEWLNARHIIESRLLSLLGRAPVIRARYCELREIDATRAGEFLTATHLQGKASSSATLHLGLFHHDTLIAVASFGPCRGGNMTSRKSSTIWEVLRYASTGSVTGGFARLLQAFIHRTASERIVSYCDLRFGNGDLYRHNGFVLESLSEPDYWWLPGKGGLKRISRYQTQKHKLATHPELKAHFAPDKTEREICESAGWIRILGVGHQKWVRCPPQTNILAS